MNKQELINFIKNYIIETNNLIGTPKIQSVIESKCFNKYDIDELQKMKTSILIENMHKIETIKFLKGL
tara:strand:+ start:723 stop:926 length:204 start_codon:yes stop_codon:yes gene_type:complete